MAPETGAGNGRSTGADQAGDTQGRSLAQRVADRLRRLWRVENLAADAGERYEAGHGQSIGAGAPRDATGSDAAAPTPRLSVDLAPPSGPGLALSSEPGGGLGREGLGSAVAAGDRSAGVPSGRELPRRPHWSGKSTLAWRGGDFDLAGDLRFAGGRFDDLANRIPLGAYTVVDLAATYRASPIIDLQFRLANALDRRYETTSLYPALGREAFFTIRYHGTR